MAAEKRTCFLLFAQCLTYQISGNSSNHCTLSVSSQLKQTVIDGTTLHLDLAVSVCIQHLRSFDLVINHEQSTEQVLAVLSCDTPFSNPQWCFLRVN